MFLTFAKGQEGFPLNKHRQRSSATTWNGGYDPLDMVSLILVERNPLIQSSTIKDVDQSSTSNIFLCLPREILGNMHPHIMHCIITGFPFSGLLIFLLFISVEMALEHTIKDIQAQNSQLQEMFLNLSQGQEEIKALLTRGMVLGNSGSVRNDQLEEL